jgi:pre-mRNA-splicing helicase BRR2
VRGGGGDGGRLFVLKQKFVGEPHTVSFVVPLFEPLPPQYFVRVVSDRWIMSEVPPPFDLVRVLTPPPQSVLPLSFRYLLLPERFPPQTELLDLQPLPPSALKHPPFEALYKDIRVFNPIQTQVFNALFNSAENVLVCAPTGSGKTICAEFALLRAFAENPRAKCVYVAPLKEIVELRYFEWSERFGKGLGKSVVMLTGETNADMKLL